MAFNAKNLEYNKQEPAFLRKLKGEFSGLDGRHNVQIARPKKDRLRTGDDDEDEPVIVDEQGERIEKAEFERRLKGEDDGDTPAAMETAADSAEEDVKHSERQRVTEIGSSANAKKRKVGKLVGGEGGNQQGESDEDDKQKRLAQGKAEKVSPAKKPAAAPKKKGKKIKLSFDEPE
ncbi:hypothetical protein PV04_09467 [Phialophora macrospora]|uniref:DUF4604 domain-containing protein n=1 Tax=Phialophora macrospora TaxID=1851006 RepID=A0A0D2CH81_9EURO|nr:hypothetical protein PV04_09467 [Phialophora macrospora]